MLGIFSYGFSLPIYENTIVGIDGYFLVNALSFYHLRHSHINMSYGWLEKWFLSPSQHHLHHSMETRHWDKNFGLLLSIWDRMFGTFLYSEPRGSFRLGLPQNEAQGYRSVMELYITPFKNVGKMTQDRLSSKLASAQPEQIGGTDPGPIAS